MPNQVILSWSVSVAGTPRTPAQAAAALAAVPLYVNQQTDPVLGQLFGLTVASDTTGTTATGATRTLTLNFTSAVGAPFAPPPFPCNPNTATPPTPPYELLEAEPLAGSFLTVPGSAVVDTSESQLPALNPGDTLQFLSQPGVFYEVFTVSAGTVMLMTTYSGPATADLGAALMEPNPATVVAVYSTSPLDTAGVPTAVPPIPAGSGAQTVSLSYLDSTGAGPFTVDVSLSGKLPVFIPLALGSIDVATITDLHVASAGGFGNSVGQITLAELSGVTPAPATLTPQAYQQYVDQVQVSITRPLAYLPPSYSALAGQSAAAPMLAGDFFVSTRSTSVPTSVDQTAVLAPGNVIQFASQPEIDTPFGAVPVYYTVAAVTPRQVTLATPYTGLNLLNRPPQTATGTKGVVAPSVNGLATAATLVSPSPATPPANAALAAPLAQFVNAGNAVPPPNPPLPPGAMAPPPTFLSDFFTQTLQLALAGVPIVAQPIALA